MAVADEMGPTAPVADDDPYGPRPTWRGWLHFAAFLVERGIDSISLNPDSVVRTKQRILEEEKKQSGK